MRRVVIAVVALSACLAAACASEPKALTDDLEELKKKVKVLEENVAEHDARLKGTKRNPSNTRIILSKNSAGGGSACDTAKVLDSRVGNEHDRHVRWEIEGDCIPLGAKIELRFVANKKGQFPFSMQNVQARGGNRFVQEKIKPSADVDYGVFTYSIWLVPGIGTPKQLADPELEVEPPPVVVASGAAPSTPPKKQ